MGRGNLKTNRSIRIKTAQKLRAEVGDGSPQNATGDATATDPPTATRGRPGPEDANVGHSRKKKGRKHKSGITVVGDKPGESQVADTPATGKKAQEPKAPKEPKVKRVSALDAAAQVLAAAGKPMYAKEMVVEMAAQNLWKSPGGKTPEATLYAAVIREISAKGAESRLRKVDRGQFESTGR